MWFRMQNYQYLLVKKYSYSLTKRYLVRMCFYVTKNPNLVTFTVKISKLQLLIGSKVFVHENSEGNIANKEEEFCWRILLLQNRKAFCFARF